MFYAGICVCVCVNTNKSWMLQIPWMMCMFDVIKQHCSFFNYDLIESLIKVIGTNVDKQRLCDYLKHFKQYAERKLCECPSKLNWVPVTAGKSARLVLKLASKCCTYTAKEIRQLRIHICEALGLQLNFPYALMFEEWRKNGEDIELVFQAPCVLIPALKPLSPEQQRILDGHSVLSFSVNGYNTNISIETMSCPCRINEIGYLGRTPLQWAQSNGHEVVAQYIELCSSKYCAFVCSRIIMTMHN